jgi:isoleucyl-tRNA synthetase
VEAYRKIRNTFRFLLSNLYDFDPAADSVPHGKLEEVDRYLLSRYGRVAAEMMAAHEAYDFQHVSHLLNSFATVDLSAFYLDVSKDRLYTLAPDSGERRSAQTTMYRIADGLARLAAPLVPFMAEDVWMHLPGEREASVHLAQFPRLEDVADEGLGDWEYVVETLRPNVNASLELKRAEKAIGSSQGAALKLRAGEGAAFLRRMRPDALAALFGVSRIDLEILDGNRHCPPSSEVTRAPGEKCPRCWRFVEEFDGEICLRCAGALADTATRTGSEAGKGANG